MKTATIIMMLVGFAVGSGAGQQKKVVEWDSLVERDWVVYEVDSGELFTGIMVDHYPSGQMESETEYRDGEVHVDIWWYKNGQKASEAEYSDGVEISRKKWDEARLKSYLLKSMQVYNT